MTEETPQQRPSLWRELRDTPQRGWRTVRSLAAEIWNDHDFWVHTLAVKGGASAIVIAGIVGISHVVALPFLLAAGGIVLCGAVVTFGVYGIVAGAAEAWDKLRGIYARVRGLPEAPPEAASKKTLLQKLKEAPMVQKAMHHPLSRKIASSRAWRISRKFARKEQDMLLGGLAVGGSFVSLALGLTLLATQIFLLPVIAVGSLVTAATIGAVGSLASGSVGLYLSVRSIFDRLKKRRAGKAGGSDGNGGAQPVKTDDGEDATKKNGLPVNSLKEEFAQNRTETRAAQPDTASPAASHAGKKASDGPTP